MPPRFMWGASVRARIVGCRQWLLLLACTLAISFWTSAAFAHASLISSMPSAGAVLSNAPTTAQLIFNEPVSPLVLKIIQPDGTGIDLKETRTVPDGIELPLPVLDQRGTHALSWRVVSADGHPVGGTLIFSIGAAGTSPVQAIVTTSDRAALIWLSRLIGYIGLFFGVGLAIWHALVATRDDSRPLGLWMLAVGAVATVMNVGLFGIDALDMPISGLLSLHTWWIASTTSLGLSAALTIAALMCAALVWWASSTFAQRLIAALAIVLLGAALAVSGHASAAPPTWLARPTVWLHVVAVTLWIGSLLPLIYAMGKSPDLALLRLFSKRIPVVLIAMFASGGVLIYLQFDTLPSLWQTAYGQVLMLKLALLIVLLGMAAYNRYALTDAVLRSEAIPRQKMRRLIYLECVVAVAILAVVALWRFTPPPRTLAQPPAATFVISEHLHASEAMADLSLTAATPDQPSILTVYLSTPEFAPLIAQEVDVALSNPQAGIEPIVFSAKKIGESTWEVKDVELPNISNWQVRIDVLISDFERISLETMPEPAM